MIKTAAQMKNLRRGNDAQGFLKRIDLDSSSEGYSNFMAPLRMKMVEADAKYAREHLNAHDADVFNKRILRPSTDTYLTPEWDEFVPFPTSKSKSSSHSSWIFPFLSPSSNRVTDSLPPLSAWKLCYDGFGPSNYGGSRDGVEYSMLQESIAGLPDDFPPFYQPQGVSKHGGSFAETTCACNGPGVVCQCQYGARHNTESLNSTSNGHIKVEERTPMPAERTHIASAGCGVPGEHMPRVAG